MTLFWLSHLGQAVDKASAEKVLAYLNSLNSLKTLFWMEVLSLLGAVNRGVVVPQDCAQFLTVGPLSCNVVQLLTNDRSVRAVVE